MQIKPPNSKANLDSCLQADYVALAESWCKLNAEHKAALADLKKLADCGNCKHEITDERCEASDSNCDKCKHTSACKHCLYGSNWEWRGLGD